MIGFPAIGEQIGAFRIDAEIGRGGMGTVYRATQLTLNRPVALKVLDPRLAADSSFVDRFSREAAILASVDSPHIIQIFDHGNLDGRLFLAMQYVSGGDLSQLVSRVGALSPHAALQVFSQVLGALGDAHARGIVHRDVKPSNVLLRADGTEPFAYLCDFGIAQAPEGGLTQPGLVAGSWAFMSPERHAGEPATPQSDLYSAACVLWSMLTSRNVYSGTDIQVAMAHLNSPVPQLPGSDPLTVELNRLLWACLAKNPADRPGSAAEALALVQRPLAMATGVPPLQILKPDSGIFRPSHATAADVAGARDPEATASDTVLAARTPVTTPTGPAPTSGATAPTPVPPVVPRPTSVPRWLMGAGALVLAVLLILGILNFSGLLGGRSTAAAPSPSPSGSAVASPTATAAAIACWNGPEVGAMVECPAPHGKAGLRWVYPSLDEGWDDCTHKAYRATTTAYDCTVAGGLIRYRYWQDSDEASTHYTKKFAKGSRTPMLLDGHEVGVVYRLDKKVSGIYSLSGLWLDKHLSFSIEAATIEKRDALLSEVRVRAYDQLNGQVVGESAREAELG